MCGPPGEGTGLLVRVNLSNHAHGRRMHTASQFALMIELWAIGRCTGLPARSAQIGGYFASVDDRVSGGRPGVTPRSVTGPSIVVAAARLLPGEQKP